MILIYYPLQFLSLAASNKVSFTNGSEIDHSHYHTYLNFNLPGFSVSANLSDGFYCHLNHAWLFGNSQRECNFLQPFWRNLWGEKSLDSTYCTVKLHFSDPGSHFPTICRQKHLNHILRNQDKHCIIVNKNIKVVTKPVTWIPKSFLHQAVSALSSIG